jgi:D-alanine--poly(phosphoribitol) ligase subunit 1
MDLFTSLATGGTLYSLTAEQIGNPREMYRALATSAITTWVSTPSFARLCLAEPTFHRDMLPELSRFLFCGEILPPSLVAELLDRFPDAAIWNTYGPTEATVATTSVRVDRPLLARYSPLPVGYPKPDSRIFVLDDAGLPLSPGQHGEIVIAGPQVSAGYVGRPDLNELAFFEIDGLRAYRTGDRGMLLDGMLFFEGRSDDQVKLHGYRIELGEVEAQIRALPAVRDAVVLPVQREGIVAALATVVIPTENCEKEPSQLVRTLRGQLAKRLPAYMLPRKWKVVDAFPMTPNGKVDRRALRDVLERDSASSAVPSWMP